MCRWTTLDSRQLPSSFWRSAIKQRISTAGKASCCGHGWGPWFRQIAGRQVTCRELRCGRRGASRGIFSGDRREKEAGVLSGFGRQRRHSPSAWGPEGRLGEQLSGALDVWTRAKCGPTLWNGACGQSPCMQHQPHPLPHCCNVSRRLPAGVRGQGPDRQQLPASRGAGSLC